MTAPADKSKSVSDGTSDDTPRTRVIQGVTYVVGPDGTWKPKPSVYGLPTQENIE